MKKGVKELLLASCLVATAFSSVGCSNGQTTLEEIDPTKTQLYVSNLQGGIGHEWLQKAKERFETAYANESFETDKTGVQIIIDTENGVNGGWLILPTSEWEVFFTENMSFNDYASRGELLDISDVVKAPAYGETATIESKLDDAQKAGLTAYDGKYYVLPHYEAYRGLSYNVTFFESEKLYFSDAPTTGSGGFIVRDNEKRSAGPNGEYGDYDDGLPSTVEEFLTLCDKIAGVGTPFIWPGATQAYSEYIVDAFAAAFMGADELSYNYSYDSGNDTTKVITDFDGDTPTTQDVQIKNDNGYLIRQQSAKYYAYSVFEKIVDKLDEYVWDKTIGDTAFTQFDAQEWFLVGMHEQKPIGMISDGNYWYNESKASGAYQRTVDLYSEAENTKYAWMPLPGVWSKTAGTTPKTESVLKDTMQSYCFINGNISENAEKVKLAKAFVSFCYTDESLREFTTTTGVAKGMKYELTTDDYNALSSYGKSCWDVRKDSKIVRLLSTNRMFIENQDAFTKNLHDSTVSGQAYKTPYTAFKANVSAKDYFKGTWIASTTWSDDYNRYFTSGV